MELHNTFTKKEMAMFMRMDTPAKVQDFLNRIPMNFEHDKIDTAKSPLETLRKNNAHCIEGAMLGAYILSLHGHRPLLMHLEVTDDDLDHVIAPFRIAGHWGALSKTNHAVLRYRDPIYKTIRELAMSYFHEYFLADGTKTLRRYSKPLDLRGFQDDWGTLPGDLWGIDDELDEIKHFDIVPKSILGSLRKADSIERRSGLYTEWPGDD